MCLQTVLFAMKSISLFVMSLLCYICMLWGLSVITPVSYGNSSHCEMLLIGWAVMLVSWWVAIKIWKKLDNVICCRFFSLVLSVLFALFSLSLFLDGLFVMLFDHHSCELFSGVCMVLFSMVTLRYTVKVWRNGQ